MLHVLRGASSAFEPRPKDLTDEDFPLILETDVVEPVELIDDDGTDQNAVDATGCQSQQVSADADFAGEEDEFGEEEDEDDSDSDYQPGEGGSEADDDDLDDERYLKSVEMELDDHADEVSDFYLKRMLEKRGQEGEDEVWVNKYVRAQQAWKERHGSSIDEMDLDLHLAGAQRKRLSSEEDGSVYVQSVVDVWNGRVAPHLPVALRNQPTEYVFSLVVVALFVVIALAVQFYVTFKAPLYT